MAKSGDIAIIFVALFFVWLVYGGTYVNLEYPDDVSITKNDIHVVSFSITSKYSDAKIVKTSVSSNDERLLFSLDQNALWDNKISFDSELGPKSKTDFNFFINVPDNIPHGTYTIYLEVDRGGIYHSKTEKFQLNVLQQ